MAVRAGTEGFESELKPWSVLGAHALETEDYLPDFTASVIGACRLLKICREDFLEAQVGRKGGVNEGRTFNYWGSNITRTSCLRYIKLYTSVSPPPLSLSSL